ncbi:GNAT family N-acetyltransferase [Vogesella sp. LIG4]|uniref:GNAT family N-acetyltransferase n=1 Tax=Vogesella sp. LIG4 TaxID=1192162 RepID=UPI00081FA318|nr:GNAT family N-acetyltransferase [Vogesella sp. LIG4]SCK22293.1 Acetyltransferase (GNAT) domain-containing protein [Vogesella sp. LIG4]
MNRAPHALQPDAHGEWLQQGQQLGGRHWVSNAPCRISLYPSRHGPLPVTQLQQSSTQDSYVASPRSAWLRYPQAEARHHGGRVQALAALAASPLGGLISAARLDSALLPDNWLLSTNLHPQWQDAELAELRDSLLTPNPERPLLLRNVCAAANPGLPTQLAAQGWLLLPARLVYLCDPAQPEVWRRNHVKRDQRLLEQSDLRLLGPDDIRPEQLPQLQYCFRDLFIDKHSALNPDFSAHFFQLCLQRRFLELYALELGGNVVGCIGLLARHGWLTTPLIGYDTRLPPKLGIYRRLMALLLREAQQRGLQLHYSAGAGEFKRHRGGEPQLEYSAVYARHLGKRQQLALSTLAALLQRTATPLLQRYG